MDEMDLESLPNVVTLNRDQTIYVTQVLNSTANVLQNQSTLENEEKLLGQGNYFWPKNPKQPPELIKLYKDFQIHGMWIRFERTENNGHWTKATTIITPKNFPKGSYQITLEKSFWPKLILEKSYFKEYPNQSPAKVKLSRYLHEHKKIQYEFFENAETALDEKYPSRFFSVELTKFSG